MDVRLIQQMTRDLLAEDIHLFGAEPVTLPGTVGFAAGFRPSAAVQYYLRSPEIVSIVIKDESGNIVNDLEGTGDAGFNQAVWDLSHAGAPVGRRGPPLVAAGEYTVEVTAGSHRAEGTIEVRN